MENFDLRKYLAENKLTTNSKLLEDTRDVKEKVSFFRNIKPGDKLTYLGKDKNGFTRKDIVVVDSVAVSSTFDRTLTIKKGGKKLRVSTPSTVGPIIKSPQEMSIKELIARIEEIEKGRKIEDARELKDLRAELSYRYHFKNESLEEIGMFNKIK